MDKSLKNWIKDNGGNVDNVKIGFHEKNERGVVATHDIREGDRILFVPHKLLITFKMAIESPLGIKIFKQPELYNQLTAKKHVMLALFVLQERLKKSEDTLFGPYIDSLPQDFNNFPILYNAEELEELTGSPVLGATNKMKDEFISQYNLICSQFEEIKQFSER